MATTTSLAGAVERELGGFGGTLIGPDDSGYDEARTVYNAMIDRRPGVIARCSSVEDVQAVVGFARRHEALLAVRGGGHNGGGLGVCDEGVVCDLSQLRAIMVDADARTVRVEGGCTWGEVDRKTHEAGLAVPSGIIGTTGVGGLSLGGGIGHLSRRHGLTVDNLIEAEMVLADGSRVRASADENPDLYWAIRGGGGNFGVVTAFVFRLHPVSTVIAGPTFWPIEQSGDVMRAYREFLPAADRDVNGFFMFGSVPPAPPFPEELHGRPVCGIVWCHLGSEERAAGAVAPMLDVGTPLMHGVGPVPFPGIQSAFDGLYPTGLQWYWRADFVRSLTDPAIDVHSAWGPKMPTGHSTMHMYPIDGAVHDAAEGDTAFAYRDVTWAEVIVGVDPDPANAGAIRDWTVGYWDATHPHSAGGAYVNFMMDEGQERVRATYRGNYERLAQVKAQYDPDNLFRVNQNIRPAA
ncbi:MAG: FAD-binding oxidoreductase [Kineosporiaceae bacterium]